VEELVNQGEIDADYIMTPGIYVNRLVEVRNSTKPIEQRTTRAI